MSIRLVVLGLLLFGVSVTPARALDVTGCPLIVPPGETATLQADVNCGLAAAPQYNAYGIVLGHRARLDLNGHTLRQVGFDLLTSVYCLGKCEVVGPGRITTTDVGVGILSFRRGLVTVSHLTIDDLVSGISVPFGRAIVSDVHIQARLYGIEARKLTVADVNVTLDETGDYLSRCVATAGGWVKGADLTVGGCDIGIEAKSKVELTRFTSAGGEIGILSKGKVTLVDSSVTGAISPPNGLDILSKKLPVLTNTVCDHSGKLDRSWPGVPAVPWGVCSGD